MSHGHHHHIHDVAAPVVQKPSPSLLRLSVSQRLLGAAVVLAALWAAVLWALHA